MIEQEKLNKMILAAYIIISITTTSMLIYYRFIDDRPRIEIKQNIIDEETAAKNNITTFGLYTGTEIILSMESDEMLENIYHEYGHYLYYKKLSSKEKKQWNTEFCQQIDRLEYYDDEDQCIEKFAKNFAMFMQRKSYRYAYDRNWDSFEIFNYTKTLYFKYIDDE